MVVASPPVDPPDGASMTPKQLQQYERDRKKALAAEKKAEKKAAAAEPVIQRWAYLTGPIVEGPQYKLGTKSASGNTLFSGRAQDPFGDRLLWTHRRHVTAVNA